MHLAFLQRLGYVLSEAERKEIEETQQAEARVSARTSRSLTPTLAVGFATQVRPDAEGPCKAQNCCSVKVLR
jgi:hypothetical protein